MCVETDVKTSSEIDAIPCFQDTGVPVLALLNRIPHDRTLCERATLFWKRGGDADRKIMSTLPNCARKDAKQLFASNTSDKVALHVGSLADLVSEMCASGSDSVLNCTFSSYFPRIAFAQNFYFCKKNYIGCLDFYFLPSSKILLESKVRASSN